MKNKRGMEMLWSTVVYIVLALALLAVLILILVMYSGSFVDGIKNYFSKSNVDSTVRACNNFVLGNEKYEFCCVYRDIKLSNKEKLNLTCSEFGNKSFGKEVELIDCREVCIK